MVAKLLKIKDWVLSKLYTAYRKIVMYQNLLLMTNLFLAVITFYYALLTKNMLLEVKEQKAIAVKAYQGTIKPIVECNYYVGDYNEAFIIKNKGIHDIPAIQAMKRYFFVFKDGKIMTITGIYRLMQSDKLFAEKIKKSGLKSEDLNPSKIYDFGLIKSGEKAMLDIYQFDNTNALLLAKTLDCKFIVQWTIEFENTVNFETQSTLSYFLIDENGIRNNLNDMLGGKKLIEDVKAFADSTQEEIFKDVNDSILDQLK